MADERETDLFKGRRLLKLRRASGLTQAQAALQAGIDGPRWSRFETNHLHVIPTPSELGKLAEALGVLIEGLLVDDQETKDTIALWSRAYGWPEDGVEHLLELPAHNISWLTRAAKQLLKTQQDIIAQEYGAAQPGSPEGLFNLLNHPRYLNDSIIRIIDSLSTLTRNEGTALAYACANFRHPVEEVRCLTVDLEISRAAFIIFQDDFTTAWSTFAARDKVDKAPVLLRRTAKEAGSITTVICHPRAILMAGGSIDPTSYIGRHFTVAVSDTARDGGGLVKTFDEWWGKSPVPLL